MEFWQFCSAVTRQIHFKPDRAAVEEEIMAHLEDRRDAYMSRGMIQRDAKEAAIRAMGDPEEIGRALDKLHSPWLGWFQIWFSRVVIVVMVAAGFALLQVVSGVLLLFLEPQQAATDFFDFGDRYADVVTADFQPDAVWQYEGYTFTVQRALVAQYEDGLRAMYYRLKASNHNPWVGGPEFREWLWAEDDLGNHYPCRGEEAYYYDVGMRDSAGNPSAIDYFESYYDLWVTGIEPDAKQVTLCFDRYGETAIRLTVPLEGGNADG